jgi:hypothetical protein
MLTLMSTTPVPKVFLSHSHADKRIARHLVRRFTAHGIKVWIDDAELRLGAKLTASLRAQIEDAETLLIIASQASVDSKWVAMELELAREHGKTIIPFFIEPLSDHQNFRDHLGIDATSHPSFADVVQRLMRDLFRSVDRELPSPDAAMLRAGLHALAKEDPSVAPLILSCLEGKGVPQQNTDTVDNAAFHSQDEALNALFDLQPTA